MRYVVIMKNKMSRSNRGIALAIAVLFTAFLWAGAGQAGAYYGNQNQNGYWDNHHQYHNYGYHNHHRGYWNQSNGVRLWINVG